VYGFHKVNDLIHSNLTNENQTWEFKHPNFKRGAVGDLQNIKRKSAKTQLQQLQQQRQKELQQQETFKQEEMNKEALTEGDPMSRIESLLLKVSKSCELLYNEIVHLRKVVSKQQMVRTKKNKIFFLDFLRIENFFYFYFHFRILKCNFSLI
jgi:hypothetical protein